MRKFNCWQKHQPKSAFRFDRKLSFAQTEGEHTIMQETRDSGKCFLHNGFRFPKGDCRPHLSASHCLVGMLCYDWKL
jgi:hypothetical protein